MSHIPPPSDQHEFAREEPFAQQGWSSSYQSAGVPPSPPKRRFPLWATLLIAGVVLCGLCCVSGVVVLTVIGVNSPDTKAVSGKQMRAKDVQTIRDLGLLDADEEIQYFYSWGFFDIEDGMAFFTDRKVVFYSTEIPDGVVVVPYEQIIDMTATYSDSWLVDSEILVTYEDETAVWDLVLPVSSEADRDEDFYRMLQAAWQQKRTQ